MDGISDWPLFDANVDWDTAQNNLTEAGLSDGLPMVPPTTTRIQALLDGNSDPSKSHGLIPPLFGDLNAEIVAYNCVLAGCQPGAVPIVLAAAVACTDPSFNLLGLATTTGSPAVATIVHGPITQQLDMNADVNALAPGNRANATLGRAIALVLRNVAGMATGVADMATMGQPAKYGMCFAESSDPTFPPFHVRRGLTPDESAVTVLGISGTAEVLPSIEENGNWDAPEVVLDPVAQMMRTALIAGGGARKPERGEQVLLLPPELAGLISARGWTLEQIQQHIYKAGHDAIAGSMANAPDDIHVIVTGGPGIKMTVLPLWGGGTRTVTRSIASQSAQAA